MTSLRIIDPQGQSEYLPITRMESISIGSHPSNDIQLNDPEVETLHCRISYGKKGYVAHAAGSSSLLWNGESVRMAPIAQDGILQIGQTKIELVDIDADEIIAEDEVEVVPPPRTAEPKPEKSSRKKKDNTPTTKESRSKKSGGPVIPARVSPKEVPEEVEKPVVPQLSSLSLEFAKEEEQERQKQEKKAALAERRKYEGRRPGEQDILRSPFILSLAGISVLLIVCALVYGFMFARNIALQQYQTAENERQQGHHSQAIQLYTDFLNDHPRHAQAGLASIHRSLSEIDLKIVGSSPNWSEGLTILEQLIQRVRDFPEGKEQFPVFRDYAGKISLGSATAAGDRLQKEQIDISDKAKAVFMRMITAEQPQTEMLTAIETARAKSIALITKSEILNAGIAAIQQSIDQNATVQGFKQHRELLNRYVEFRNYPQLRQMFDELLMLERNHVILATPENKQTPPLPVTQDSTFERKTVTIRSRTRSDRTDSGRYVIAVAKESCFALDTATGEPKWRQVIGMNTPFLPFPLSTSVGGYLAFDTNVNQLKFLNEENGNILWRCPVEGEVTSLPLIHGGQIYLATRTGLLYQIDAESGHIIRSLTFPQPIVGAPILSVDQSQMYIAGDQEVIYCLDARQLTCSGVFPFGHSAGSIRTSLVLLGKNVMCSYIVSGKSSRLAVLGPIETEKVFQILHQESFEGVMMDSPLLRGNQLFVPVRPERVIVYNVSDEAGQKALTRLISYEKQNPIDRPIYLSAGPDGQLWFACQSIIRLLLSKDGFVPTDESLVKSRITEPLQNLENRLFISRQLPFSGAIYFTETDRETLISSWQTTVGAAILTMIPLSQPDQYICLTEAGTIVRMNVSEQQKNSYILTALSELAPGTQMTQPLRVATTPNGYSLVLGNDGKNKAWLVNANGVVEQTTLLAAPPVLKPLVINNRIIVALEGQLMCIPLTKNETAYQNYLLPNDNGNTANWLDLKFINETTFLAVTDDHLVHKMQIRQDPTFHIAEITAVKMTTDAVLGYWPERDVIISCESDGNIRFLDVNTLAQRQSLALQAPYISGPWISGATIFVQVDPDRIVAINNPESKTPLWEFKCTSSPLIAAPLQFQNQFIMAQQNGRLTWVEQQTGKVQRQEFLNQNLSCPPVIATSASGKIFLRCGLEEGSLISIPMNTSKAE
jgi:outer membrane protein assembly factor BamB